MHTYITPVSLFEVTSLENSSRYLIFHFCCSRHMRDMHVPVPRDFLRAERDGAIRDGGCIQGVPDADILRRVRGRG